ncbi:MAG TPA: TadE/TadG family type IV pilus assembly protein [Acidimicrobiia bacterium]|jgi:Flp pilus assembly protein TadG|nr:TadE/TadG family type IV pilus assembly protein [Acidimicrobiia bacterium]
MQGRVSRRRRERGASLVEAALVFPILILIVMGTMEIGLAFKDYLTVSYISREGARLGALAGDDPNADCTILRGIGGLATSKDLARIDEIQIFKADEGTGAQGVTNTATYIEGEDPTICNVPSTPTDGWTINPINWSPTSRQTTVGTDSLDIIGVRVIMTRSWVTNFPPFRGTFQIDESTLTRLEPQAFE